jgi:uncharacterized protein (DUF924 family)
MRTTPREILGFWLDEVGPEGWYGGGPALDARVRARFAPAWRAARGGAFDDWQASPEGALALLILTDQFPRNLHRGSALAFATDLRARRIARRALDRGDDRRTPERAREFFYLPFMHSERLIDQDLSCRLYRMRLPRQRADKMPHALAHRAVISRFGRFPYRNAALGRETTPEEARWLERVGYMGEVRRFKP